MGESKNQNDLEQALRPFYQRASEAEERLSRLEDALAKEKDAENEELLKKIRQLESELEEAKSEHEKAQKLADENAKQQYRITHLNRAVRDLETKLESK